MSNQHDMENAQRQQAAYDGAGQAHMGGLGAAAATAAPATVRSNAGEILIQSERYAALVIRLREILEQSGVIEQRGENVSKMDEPPVRNDLHSTLETAQSTVRAGNNIFEDLLNTMESSLL